MQLNRMKIEMNIVFDIYISKFTKCINQIGFTYVSLMRTGNDCGSESLERKCTK
ncbi:hypothetical protein M5D96_008964 [Drosophila gunungcola]|uniref:Uncharacterized protein n=1 Tax=Drosophila gunungcola TaxID=103775 RepID=A0A9P9YJQ7_9MUSC|nr:hypothetical protein M5D96_008964 [Drosophila gunungcola]